MAQFGSKKTALKQLGVSDKDWNVLGDLANNQPLIQGRHRGEAAGMLRSAESYELDTARKIAAMLVEKYLQLLEDPDNR